MADAKSFVGAFGAGFRVSDIVMAVGGSTARTATELGVSQRSVQRYLAFESGSGKQARSTARMQPKINEAGRRLLARRTQVQLRGTIAVNQVDYERDRRISWPLTPGQWSALVERAQAGDERGAAAVFARAYQVDDIFLIDAIVS